MVPGTKAEKIKSADQMVIAVNSILTSTLRNVPVPQTNAKKQKITQVIMRNAIMIFPLSLR